MIRTRPMLPDPNDEMVLETTIHGRADAIVTFNERDFRPVAARFRCSVVRPGEIVRGLVEEPSNGKRRSEIMRRSNFALRVPPTLLAEARKAAESEGVSLNQLITLALMASSD
jgi:predicted HicB family RNase H-like nuclease